MRLCLLLAMLAFLPTALGQGTRIKDLPLVTTIGTNARVAIDDTIGMRGATTYLLGQALGPYVNPTNQSGVTITNGFLSGRFQLYGSGLEIDGNETNDISGNIRSVLFDDLLSFELANVTTSYIDSNNSTTIRSGGDLTLWGVSNVYFLTPGALAFSAPSNAVLTVKDPLTGKVDFTPIETLIASTLTASKATYLNSQKQLATSTADGAKLDYLANVTGDLQGQVDARTDFAFSTVDSMRAVSSTLRTLTGARFVTTGRASAGDGGGAGFVWSSSSTASTNRGTVFAPTGWNGTDAGRFVWDSTGRYNVRMFGAKGDNSADDTAAIQNAWDSRAGLPVWIPAGKYPVTHLDFVTTSTADSQIVRGDGSKDDTSGTIISGTDLTQPVITIGGVTAQGVVPQIGGFTVRYATRPTSSNTNAFGLYFTGGYDGTVSDIAIFNTYDAVRFADNAQVFSCVFSGIHVQGYAHSGLWLSGSGATQSEWQQCDVRNYPSTGTTASSSSVSAVGAVVTITGLDSTFVSGLRTGMIVSVTGLTPSAYNVWATVTVNSSTSISYTLNSAAGSAPSGTATVENFTGIATGPAVYVGSGTEAVFNSLNIEWVATDSAMTLAGPTKIGSMHMEGFFGTYAGANQVISATAPVTIDNTSWINSGIVAGSSYKFILAYGATGNAQIQSFSTRDLWFTGSTLVAQTVSAGGSCRIGRHTKLTTLRTANRTSAFSYEPEFNWAMRNSGSWHNIKFDLSDTGTDRETIFTGNTLSAVANTDGTTERGYTLQAGHTSQGLYVFTPNTTNTAVEFLPSTSDRRISFSGSTIRALANSDGSEQDLYLQYGLTNRTLNVYQTGVARAAFQFTQASSDNRLLLGGNNISSTANTTGTGEKTLYLQYGYTSSPLNIFQTGGANMTAYSFSPSTTDRKMTFSNGGIDMTLNSASTAATLTLQASGGDTVVTGNLRNSVLTASKVVVTDGSKNLASASVAITDLATVVNLNPSVSTLVDGATITWTVSSSQPKQLGRVTLGGNRTLAFSGLSAGMNGWLWVKQDGTGSRTLTLPAGSKVVSGGAGAVTLTTTANAEDRLSFVYDGTNLYWVLEKNFN